MIRTIGLFVLLVVAFAACNNPATKKEVTEDVDSTEVNCGEHENTSCAIFVDSLINDPSAFLGEELTVCGFVTHVCAHSGDKLFLSPSTKSKETIVVTISEDMETFEQELLNKHVMVTGIVKEVEAEDEVETHHNHEIVYYVECIKVVECGCKDGKTPCKGHDSDKPCKGHDTDKPCAGHDTDTDKPCKGHDADTDKPCAGHDTDEAKPCSHGE